MSESVRGRPEDDPFGETCTATTYDHDVRLAGFTDGDQPAHRIAELLDRLVVEAFEIEFLLDLAEDPLLSLHECGG